MNGLSRAGVFIIFFLSSTLYGQSYKTATEIGFYGGGAYYLGDLNKSRHFVDSKVGTGLIYRYNYSKRFSLRATAFYGGVKANDANSNLLADQNRNLNFESSLIEIGFGCEIDFFDYRITDMKFPISPYFFYQLAYMRMNPKTTLNGNTIDLQPLGTEGQETVLSDKSNYSLNQIVIPLGIGLKMNLRKGLAVSFEYGIRKTFTDYLDDVSGNYVDSDILRTENGPLSAQLANREIEASNVLNRGNSTNKDWYSFYGVMLTFKPFKRNVCTDMKGR